MDFEQAEQYREVIEKAARDLYRNDIRVRQLVDSSVAVAGEDAGSADPGYEREHAYSIAQRACALLAARILHEDAELMVARAQRDHYKKLAEAAFTLPPSMFVPVHAVNEFPKFIEQVREDGK